MTTRTGEIIKKKDESDGSKLYKSRFITFFQVPWELNHLWTNKFNKQISMVQKGARNEWHTYSNL